MEEDPIMISSKCKHVCIQPPSRDKESSKAFATAGFRSLLEDFEFEFVEGRMPHTEGNWSLHTKEFSQSKLWGYYNPFDPQDILSAEQDILDFAAEEGPFNGILGYSQGATLAAQTILRHAQMYPNATPDEIPFRFAIFFNGGTPGNVFPLTEEICETSPENLPLAEAQVYSMIRSNKTKEVPVRLGRLPNGRYIVTNGVQGMCKWDAGMDGQVINIPTLHVRCPADHKEYGEGLYSLCDPKLAKQFIHTHGHDFPRGYHEMRALARLVRTVAEMAA